jgi:adenylosuccinate synthase
MPVTIILGAQWGDEGKGRAVDWLSSQADIAARATGGDNAGHTLNVGEHLLKLHLVPSGVLHPNVVCVLGNGMVINPVNLVKELDKLAALGLDVSPERIKLSTRAHVTTPAHLAQDAAQEQARGADKIGTTLRGIGPTYLDKVGRRGIRAAEMADLEAFAEKLTASLTRASTSLVRDGFGAVEIEAGVAAYVEAAAKLRPYLTDTTEYLNRRLKDGARVVCEGAQGMMLDIDFGSYPFVTSSSPTVGGTLSGLGFGPKHVQRVVGVAKAYSTRVGSGPMPTELLDALGDRLRGTGANFWDEYGTTTGRPRRCGWLDMVVLRYSAAVNGFTELVVTKLDILSGFDEVKICVAYDIDGQRYEYMPARIEDVERATPVYETLAGWHEPITGVRKVEDLPLNAQRYIARIAQLADVPVNVISVGPERDQLVFAV